MAVSAEFMRRIAAAAAEETLPRFRRKGDVVNKLEAGFDPVTEADREAERAIRQLITSAFPDHGILGEEFGVENGDAEHLWVIDPIDGTRSFISGVPLWGTLVGLAHRGDAIAGMMAQPFTGELFYALDDGAHWEGRGASQRLETRATTQLADATICTTTPELFKDAKQDSFRRLEQACRLSRYGTDCYAYCMLAAGHVDIVVEVGLQVYDIMALIPIIEKAGGVITNWSGGPAENVEGGVVAAANASLHEAAMRELHGG